MSARHAGRPEAAHRQGQHAARGRRSAVPSMGRPSPARSIKQRRKAIEMCHYALGRLLNRPAAELAAAPVLSVCEWVDAMPPGGEARDKARRLVRKLARLTTAAE